MVTGCLCIAFVLLVQAAYLATTEREAWECLGIAAWVLSDLWPRFFS